MWSSLVQWCRQRPNAVAVVILSGVFLAIAIPLTRWDGPYPTDEMGALGEWVGALATAGALFIALDPRRLEHARAADEQRVDASKIILSDLVFSSHGTDNALHVRVGNYSASPIREVRIELAWTERAAMEVLAPFSRGDGENHESGVEPVGRRWVGHLAAVLAAGEVQTPGPVAVFQSSPEHVSQADLEEWGVRFVDVHGGEWVHYFGRIHGTGARLQRLKRASEPRG